MLMSADLYAVLTSRVILSAIILSAAAVAFKAVAVPRGALTPILSSGLGSGGSEPVPVLSNKQLATAHVAQLDAANYQNFFASNGVITQADILAMFQIESRFDPMALRLNDGGQGVHAYGIGQMLSTTAADVGISNPNDLFVLEIGVKATMDYMIWIYNFLTSQLGRQPTAREWVGAYNIGVGNILNGNFPLTYLTKQAAAKLLL